MTFLSTDRHIHISLNCKFDPILFGLSTSQSLEIVSVLIFLLAHNVSHLFSVPFMVFKSYLFNAFDFFFYLIFRFVFKTRQSWTEVSFLIFFLCIRWFLYQIVNIYDAAHRMKILGVTNMLIKTHLMATLIVPIR